MGIKGFPKRKKIAPRQPLLSRLLQQVTRMETCQHRNFFAPDGEVKPFAAQRKQPVALARQALRRMAAKAENESRPAEFNGAHDVGLAYLDFRIGRRAVSRRPPRNEIE